MIFVTGRAQKVQSRYRFKLDHQKRYPHYGLKEHASVDTNHGFILATTISEASVNDTNYLDYCSVFSKHTKTPIKKVYADKGYAGMPNRDFLATNKIADGIMRKDSTTAKLTDLEIERNKKIFTPLKLFCVLFNWGPKAMPPAQLNRVLFGKFNRVKTVFWYQPSEGQRQTGPIPTDR